VRERISVRAAVLGLAASWLVAIPAQAQQERPVMLVVGGSMSWDNNFFRVPNDLAQSERISTAYVGLSLDTVYAQQQFQLRVIQQFNRYQTFSYLDFDPLNVDAAWRWHFSPRVSGSLTYARTQNLNSFEDTRNFTQRNIRTSQNADFNMDAQLSGGWHFLMAVPLTSQINSQEFVGQQSYREVSMTPGVRYIWPSGNSGTFKQTFLRGKFVDLPGAVSQIDTSYRQYLSDFILDWRLSGKSAISASLGWLSRDYNQLAARSFSGPVGRFQYTWNPTAKISLQAAASRSLDYYFLGIDCGSYTVTDVVSLASTWQTSAKTSLRASVSWGPTDYRGALPTCPSPERTDHTRGAELGASWTPLRNATLGASVAYQKNSSNYPGQTWDDTVAGFTASFSF
jgi:exopolysaccharide biosynthesis operon protein EpsL